MKAREIRQAYIDFFVKKGPGSGNHATNAFMKTLRHQAEIEFGECAEQSISGDSALKVDFYFPGESAIVEIALGVDKPNSEFEKDILKAVMAKQLGAYVDCLVFAGKPGSIKKCCQPGRQAMALWLKNTHGIRIEVCELTLPDDR